MLYPTELRAHNVSPIMSDNRLHTASFLGETRPDSLNFAMPRYSDALGIVKDCLPVTSTAFQDRCEHRDCGAASGKAPGTFVTEDSRRKGVRHQADRHGVGISEAKQVGLDVAHRPTGTIGMRQVLGTSTLFACRPGYATTAGPEL